MREVYRILDANLNRAREALRVAEDFARFALDDAALSEQAKLLRSDLQRLAQAFPADELLASRDTPGDVGTAISSPTERRRDTPADVAQAACKRLAEALRTLEEYAKLLSPELSARLEELRYRAYAFEQRLMARAQGPRVRFEAVRLYLLLTGSLCRRPPLEVARAAIEGGADCLQLREKDLPAARVLELARELRALTARAGVLFIVNDRPDIATLCGADGVHVGQDDLPAAAARRIVGAGKLVGVSTHSLEQARQAVADGADYIGVGPMFASGTKDAGEPQGPDLLRRVAGEIAVPHVAIGGITAENLGALAEAVARPPGAVPARPDAPQPLRVAVCGAICSADDPAAAARALHGKLAAAR